MPSSSRADINLFLLSADWSIGYMLILSQAAVRSMRVVRFETYIIICIKYKVTNIKIKRK